MLAPVHLRQFEREVAKAVKRGLDIKKLKNVMRLLVEEEPLPPKNRNHKLRGDYTGYWECHIEPDWLLVYKKTTTQIIFARTGTHSDLF
jgi:mRNA interferase YafQ